MLRRVVVALTLAAATAGLAPTAQEPATPVTLALINGRIYTLDPARPWVEALAINGERIVATGSTAAILGMARTARVIDLRGAFASPGFNDAHVHIDSTGTLLVGVNLPVTDVLTQRSQRTQRTAEPLRFCDYSAGKSLTTRRTPSTSVLAPKLMTSPRGQPAISRYVCNCRRSRSVVIATALTSTTTHSSTMKSAK